MKNANATFTVGDILVKGNVRSRVIAILPEAAILVPLDTDVIEYAKYKPAEIAVMLDSGEMTKEKEEEFVFDEDDLSVPQKAEYRKRLEMMKDVEAAFGPSFLGLGGKGTKPEVTKIMEKYGFSKSKFWRLVRRYLQSGFKKTSLLDQRVLNTNKDKDYVYKKRPGKKPKYTTGGVPLNDEHRAHMDEALKEYKSGRYKTLIGAYRDMIYKYYSEPRNVDGKTQYLPKTDPEIISEKQFYRYAEKVLDAEEMRKIKTSPMEVRNDERLLKGTTLYGVFGPGHLAEIDACEVNVALVSRFNKDQAVGRATLYFMIDVYSKSIIAMSSDFQVNSVIGITNLFLNLAEDKREYAKRYGVIFDNPSLWPSGILPRQIRMDRGAEMKSMELVRICSELGIEHQLVSGGSGSLKGNIERSFGELQSELAEFFEHNGLIDGRHDTDPHKDAIVNIDEFTTFVIRFILEHNQKCFETYKRSREMIENNVRPIPVELWDYGIGLYGQPRPITDIQQYLYTLMTPQTAKINRSGMLYEGLWYWPDDDPVLEKAMFKAGDKKQSFDIRTDPRCIGAIWYARDNRLYTAQLNPHIPGNAEYADLTLEEWEEVREIDAQMKADGREYNNRLAGDTRAVYGALIEDAKKDTPTNTKGMKEARRAERLQLEAEGRLVDKMPDAALPEKKDDDPKPHKDFKSMREAIEDLENNL